MDIVEPEGTLVSANENSPIVTAVHDTHLCEPPRPDGTFTRRFPPFAAFGLKKSAFGLMTSFPSPLAQGLRITVSPIITIDYAEDSEILYTCAGA